MEKIQSIFCKNKMLGNLGNNLNQASDLISEEPLPFYPHSEQSRVTFEQKVQLEKLKL